MSQFYPAVLSRSKVFLIALSFLLLPGGLLFAQEEVITLTSLSTNPYIVPAGVTSIKVEVWGAGGGGGGANKGGTFTGAGYGGGGGGGAYHSATLTVAPGQSITYSVGAGGGGGNGSNGNKGTDGGKTTFSSAVANGGIGGMNGYRGTGTGGAGGSGGTRNGGKGADGISVLFGPAYAGGGGGGAGNNGSGTNATDVNGANGGAGSPNAVPYRGGKGGNGGGNSNGSSGSGPGGGGGGASRTSNNGSQSGGPGASGQIVLTFTPAPEPTITSFTPTTTCLGSTPTITITGTNFTGVTSVKFNGVEATSFNFVSATSITAVLPATGVSTGPISVTTPDGIGTSSSNFTINIPPLISGHPSTGTQTICVGVAATALKVTAAGTGLSYQWYRNTTNTNTGGSTIGTNSDSYTPLTNTASEYYYYVVVSGTCTPAVTSNVSGLIKVNPPPVASAITGAAGICVGANTTLTPSPTGTAPFTYTWNSTNTAVATVTNSGLVTGVGEGTTNITYTVKDGNTCEATSAAFVFRVSPAAGAITSAGNVTGACAGGTVAMTPHALGVAPFTYSWNSSNPAVASVSSTGFVTALTLGTTNISYTVTDANGCTATSANFAFAVTVPTANNIAGPTEVCAGSSITVISNATGAGTLTYTWASSNTTVATVSATGVVSGVSEGTTDITYTVKDGNGCTATSAARTITVNPRPLVATGAVGGSTCGTGSVTISVANPGAGFTIDWYAGATGGTALVSGNNSYTTPGISATTNYYAQVRNTTTGCVSATRLTVTATFNALPASPSAPVNKEICGPGAATVSATTPTGITIDWYSASSGGTPLQSNSNSYTTPSISATTIYYAEAKNTTTGCKSAARTEVKVTVNAVPNPPSGTNNSRCGNGTVTLSASLSGAVIDWYANATGGPALVTGNNSFTTPSLSTTTTYYAESRISTTGCKSATRTAVIATINAVPAVATGATGAARCGRGSVTISVSDPGAGITIDWYSATTNGTLLQSGSNIYTTPNITGTTTYYAQVRNTTTSCVSSARLAVTATINAVPAATTTSANGSICGPGTVTITATSASGLTIDWYDASTGGGLLQSGTVAGLNSYTTPSISTTTMYYAEVRNIITGCVSTTRRQVTATINTVPPAPSPTSSNGTFADGVYSRCDDIKITATGTGGNVYFQGNNPNGTSTTAAAQTISTSGTYYFRTRSTSTGNCWSDPAAITVVVNPLPTATSVSGAGTFCGNTIITSSGGAGGTMYFQGKTNNGTSTATASSSETVTSSGTYYFRSLSPEGCWGPEGSVAVVLKAVPTGTVTVTENSGVAANDNIICEGASVKMTAPSGNNYYNFYRLGGDTLYKGTSNILNTSTLVNGDKVYVFVTNSAECATTFGPIEITVDPLPIPTLTPDKNNICVGETITFTATGGMKYNFKVNGTTVLSGTSDSYTSSTWTNGAIVTVEVTNGNNCSAVSAPVTVTVNALPTGTFTSSASPSNTLCAGENVTFTATGGVEYQFSVNGDVVQAFSTTATFSSATLENPSVVSVEVKNASGCIATLPPIVITVNALPAGSIVVTEDSGTQNDFSICADAPVTYTFPTGYKNYDFQVNGISKQSSSSNSYINTTLIAGDVVTVIVRTNANCEVTFTAPAVSIGPSPVGTLEVSDNSICAGENVTFTATPNATNTNYNFLINNVQASTGTGNTFTTNTLEDGYVVAVEVTNTNGCKTTFNAITMAVTALPTGTMAIAETSGIANDDGIICAGAEVTFTAPAGFSNYNFLLNGSSIQNGNSATYTTSTLLTGNKVTVAVTNAGNCIAVLNEFTMTVNPLPSVAAITGAAEVCAEGNITLVNATSGGKWFSSDVAIATVDENTGEVTGVLAGVVDIIYTVSNTTTNCSNTASKTITVDALPVVTAITGDLNVCVGITTTLSNATPGGVWSSGALDIATIDAAGNVSGVAEGTANISYTVTNAKGCITVITVIMNVHALPVLAPISGTFAVCINATTTLANATPGGAWTSSDPLVATINAITGVVTGVSEGPVTITYTYSDGNSCVSSITQEVVVNPLPVPTLTGPNPICLGSVDNVYKTETGQFNYTWNIVNGTVTSGGTTSDNTVTISWLTVGVKSINVNYVDANGCAGATVATVENALASSPTISGPTAVCLNSTETYSTQSANFDYDWSVTGGTITTSGDLTTKDAITIEWTGVGNRSVTVNYAEPDGCSAATPTVYAVSVKPLPKGTISLNTVNVCENGTNPTITFKGSGSVAPYTFTYDINGTEYTIISTGNNATVSAPTNVTGTFTYTLLSVQDASATACTQLQTGSLTVNVTPTPSATIAYSASPVCRSSGVISVTHTGTEGGTYTASTNLTIDATTGDITPATSSPGTYTITYRIAAFGGCAAYTTTTSVTITAAPAATISYAGAPFCTTATPKNVTRTGTAGGAYSSTAGLTINAGTGQITPASSTPGTYTITYTIGALGGCAEFTTTAEVTITAAPSATIVYNASPYCVGAGSATVTRTGTEDGTYTATPTGLTIDPATGAINLASSTEGTYTVTYSIAASGGCAAFSTTASVVINPAPTSLAGAAPVLTCTNSGAVNITAGSSATNYSSVLWTSSGTGTISNGTSLTTATYNPSAADITAGSVTLTLRANGNAGCGFVTSTKSMTINAVPSTFMIEPASATLCLGVVQPLLATGSTSTVGSQNFPSGNIDLPIEDASRYLLIFTRSGETSHEMNVSGIPALAIINSIDVKFNISHSNDQDLILNLKAPNGMIINLINRKGESGDNFINTVISSNGSNPVSGSAPPYTGTFYADAGGNGTGFPGSNTTLFTSLFGIPPNGPNGTWTFGIEDVTKGAAGTLHNWEIIINYTLPNSPIDVVWNPGIDLFTDASLSTPYTGQPLSVVYAKPSTSGTKIYTASITNASNCTTEQTVSLTVNDAPEVSISADYCTLGGKVILKASSVPGATFIWSTGKVNSDTIQVDLSGTFDVIANVAGSTCPGKASINVSNELVKNGNFELGDTLFVTDYTYSPTPMVNCNGGLYPANTYDVRTNGQLTHCNFWGKDHTSGNGNFMIVNGSGASSRVWQQAVNVLPNTKYYFSAWAMSLNSDNGLGGVRNAKLQFSVNGIPIGTTATLTDHGQFDNAPDNWVRFYGTWTSGPTTTEVLLNIINLQGAGQGNDFGLDDISFATLSTFIQLLSDEGTDAQTICKNSPIEAILYNVGNGSAAGPNVSGLPAGVTSSFNGDRLTITGTPTVAGSFTYTITTTGCGATTATGTIIVEEQKIVFTSGSAAPVCKDAIMPERVYTLSGTATGATVADLPDGVSGILSGDGKSFTISGTPTVAGTSTYTITTSGTCEAATITGSITVQEQTITLNSVVATTNQTVCINTGITNIQYTAGGTASGASFNGLPAGVTGQYISGVIIIKGTPTESGIFNYTVTTSGNCAIVTATGTINVTPAAAIALSSASGTDAQSACNNLAITPITYAVTNATGASITGGNLPADMTRGFSGGVFTISGSTAQTGTFNYTITTSGGCASATISGTITVNGQKIVLTSGSASPPVCVGAEMTEIVYTISGEATGASISGQPAGVIGTLSGNTFTVSGIPTAAAGPYLYTITTSGPNCTPATLTGIITVQPTAVGGTIASVSTCSGTGGSLTLLGNSSNPKRWEYSDNGGTTWVPISNTTVSLTYPGLSSGRQYRAVVGNNCGDVYSSIALVGIHNLWTGAIDTDWQVAGNWSDNQLPSTSCPNVYIPNTTNKPVLSNGSSIIRNIYIDAGAILTVNGTGSLHVAGTINTTGTFDASEGEIVLNGTTAQNIGAGTFMNNAVKDLKISNNTGVNVNSDLDVYGSLTFGSANARINTKDTLTLKSNINNTAWVGQMTNTQIINGKVTVERFINTGTTENPKAHRKSWQLLAVPTDGAQTINQAWQEGATATNVGSTPFSAGDPNPGYGTMIVSNAGGAAGAVALGFDQYTAPGPSIKVWNSTTGNYDGPPNTLTSPIYNIKGYLVLVRGDRSVYTYDALAKPTTLRSKGTLFTPAKPIVSYSVADGLFESVGNPYASAIDLRNVTVGGNLATSFIVWDPRAQGDYSLGAFTTLTKYPDGNFYAVPGSTSYPNPPLPATMIPYNIIESGQAFFIQATGSSGSISFPESAKVSGSKPELLRGQGGPGRQSQLRTNLYVGTGSNMTLADGNLIQYNVSYSNTLDGLDARKLTNTSENLGLRSNGKLLSVERRTPIVETDTVFYAISGMRVQPYKFEFIASDLTEFGVEGIIEDKYLGTKTPLKMEGTTEYNFTIVNIPGSYAADRFRIVFKAAAGPLPVTFVSVKAAQQGDDITVDWKVENEHNLKAYEVEKSLDGVRFVKTSQVPAGNNSVGAYTWLDKDVTAGWNYYRIKSIDVDGKVSYSEVVKVQVEMIAPLITVYPNPIVNGVINVHLVNQPAGNYKLRLLNALGQTMVAKQITREKGTSIEPLTWDYKLARGNYRIEVTKPDGGVKLITVIY